MKPDTVPFDYCGVVSSFCDPSIIRNIMNMDARSLVLLPVVAYSIDGSRFEIISPITSYVLKSTQTANRIGT